MAARFCRACKIYSSDPQSSSPHQQISVNQMATDSQYLIIIHLPLPLKKMQSLKHCYGPYLKESEIAHNKPTKYKLHKVSVGMGPNKKNILR